MIPRNNERTRWLLQEWIRANDVVPDDQIALRRCFRLTSLPHVSG